MSSTDHYPIIASTYFYRDTDSSRCKKVFRDHSENAVRNLIDECAGFLRYLDQFANLALESRINIFYNRLYTLIDKNGILRAKLMSKRV